MKVETAFIFPSDVAPDNVNVLENLSCTQTQPTKQNKTKMMTKRNIKIFSQVEHILKKFNIDIKL